MTSIIKALEESNLATHCTLSTDFEPGRRDGTHWSCTQAFLPSFEEKVDNMIARLKGTVDKIEVGWLVLCLGENELCVNFICTYMAPQVLCYQGANY